MPFSGLTAVVSAAAGSVGCAVGSGSAGASVASAVSVGSAAVFLTIVGLMKQNQTSSAESAKITTVVTTPSHAGFLPLHGIIFRTRITMIDRTIALNRATSAYQYGVLSASTWTAAEFACVYRMLWHAARIALRAVLLFVSMLAPIRHSIISLPARTARFGSIHEVFAIAESVTTMPTKPHSPRSTSVISALLAPAHVVPK